MHSIVIGQTRLFKCIDNLFEYNKIDLSTPCQFSSKLPTKKAKFMDLDFLHNRTFPRVQFGGWQTTLFPQFHLLELQINSMKYMTKTATKSFSKAITLKN